MIATEEKEAEITGVRHVRRHQHHCQQPPLHYNIITSTSQSIDLPKLGSVIKLSLSF